MAERAATPEPDAPPPPPPASPPTPLDRLRTLGDLTRRNSEEWFRTMREVLEAHGVLSFLHIRLDTAPILHADSNNRDEVLAYEKGLFLAAFFLEEYSGPDAQHCIVNRNPRASWRRLKRSFELVPLDVGLRRMRHWVGCRFIEGESMPEWLRKMEILRTQVGQARRDDDGDLSDGFCRDILLANLPRNTVKQLNIDRFATTLADVTDQLKQLGQAPAAVVESTPPEPEEALAERPPSPALSLSSDDLEIEAYFRRAPTPDWLRPAPPKPIQPPFRILDLPSELLGSILSHLTPRPTLFIAEISLTLNLALYYQIIRQLRGVCRAFADALGPAPDLALRTVTQVMHLTSHLRLHPERCDRIRTLVLSLREPAHFRKPTFELGAALRSLFRLSNLKRLYTKSYSFKPAPVNSPAPPAHPSLTELLVSTQWYPPEDPPEPEFSHVLGGLERSGSLDNLRHLTLLDIDIPDTFEHVEDFNIALLPILPRLHSFQFTSRWPTSSPPRTFDRLLPHFSTNLRSLTLNFGTYTSLEFIHSLPISCHTLTLIGPDIATKWGGHLGTLRTECVLVAKDDERTIKLDILLSTQSEEDPTHKRRTMFSNQVGAVMRSMKKEDGWEVKVEVFIIHPRITGDLRIPIPLR
ncbi:hypothetical protein RQP46_006053 [Phenoliferia psychrophenolica]